MNVCLNGNLAQIPVMHIDALLTPKKKGYIAFGLNVVLPNIKYYSIQGCKQIPSLRQTVSLLRENINRFINVTYLYMLYVCIYKIHNMIQLLCTKVKFHMKYLFGTRLLLLTSLIARR